MVPLDNLFFGKKFNPRITTIFVAYINRTDYIRVVEYSDHTMTMFYRWLLQVHQLHVGNCTTQHTLNATWVSLLKTKKLTDVVPSSITQNISPASKHPFLFLCKNYMNLHWYWWVSFYFFFQTQSPSDRAWFGGWKRSFQSYNSTCGRTHQSRKTISIAGNFWIEFLLEDFWQARKVNCKQNKLIDKNDHSSSRPSLLDVNLQL